MQVMDERAGPFARLAVGCSALLALFVSVSVLPAGLGAVVVVPLIWLFWAGIAQLILSASRPSGVDFDEWKRRRREAGCPLPEDVPTTSRVLPGAASETQAEPTSRLLSSPGSGGAGDATPLRVRTGTGRNQRGGENRDFADFLR